jgi:hypothetical protein
MNAIIKSTSNAFPNPGSGIDIPLCDNSARPKYLDSRTYTLTADIKTVVDSNNNTKRYLCFALTDSLPNPNTATDESLDMRVRADTLITLNIDPTLQARFDLARTSPLQLGPSTGAAQGVQNANSRYIAVQSDFTPKQVKFYARKDTTQGGTVPNTDALTICIVLDQYMADGKTLSAVPLSLLIDPGIKNPGDDTFGLGNSG